MIRGFDASSAQGRLDFTRVGALLRFVILKAQEGNDGFDPDFAANMRAALAAGLIVFAYCFAFPLPPKAGVRGRDPREQAKLFVDRVYAHPEMRGRPIFLDCEWPAPQDWAKWGCTAASISAWMRECCEEITRLTDGVKPIIYTYPDWWHHVAAGADVSWAAEYTNWIASYVRAWPIDGQHPLMLDPWTDWLFWQWDGDGGAKLPNGVDADFCVFNGDEEALQALVPQAA